MLSDYDDVVKMLRQSATPQVAEAQKMIRNLAMENIQMLSCLQNAIKDCGVQDSLKQMSASYINSIIRQNIADYPSEQLYIFMKSFLTDPNIHINIKRICHDSVRGILQILQDEKMINWVQLVIQCSKSPYNHVWMSSCMLLQCFAEAQIDFRYLNELINQLLEPSLSVFSNPSLSQSQFIEYCSFIKSWTIVFDKLIILTENQFGNQIVKLIINICNNQSFCQAIFKVYQFAAGSTQTYVCINFEFQAYLTKINGLKDEAACLHYQALNYMRKMKQVNSLIFKKTSSSINRLAKTLNFATLERNFFDLYECEEFLMDLFKIFNCYIDIYPEVFKESWRVFITHTLYKIIKISENQAHEFEEDPEAFIQLADDCCEDQEFQVLKTQACKCLQILVDKSKEFQNTNNQVLDFILSNTIQSIKIHLGMIPNPSQHPPPLEIESAFLLLSLFSYSLIDYVQKLQQLRIIVCDERIKNLPPLQMSRALLFLSYNYLEVFGNPNDGKHWVEFALADKPDSTLKYCCIDFLFNISDKYYSDFMLSCLINKIETEKSSNFFNLLIRLLQSHIRKIPQNLIFTIIEKCLNRIYAESIQVSKKNRTTEQIIRLLHILRIIADVHVTAENTEIKVKLWKVTEFFQTFFSLSIEDQIIRIISSFVRTSSLPLQNYLTQILPSLLSAFKRGEYYDTHYFVIFNNYVIKQDISIIQPIFNTIKEGYAYHLQNLGESPKKSVKKVAIAHHLLILQNILALYGDKINESEFNILRNLSTKLFVQNKNKFFQKILVAKALNLLLLCHMYNYSENTLSFLLQYHDQQIYFGYDIKVLLNCLKVQIFKEKDIVTIIQYLNILTRVISIYLHSKDEKQKSENEKSKKKPNSSLKITFQRHEDYQVILGFTSSPFLKVRDFPEEMKQILGTLKNKNLALYEGMINSMTSTIKQKLQYICSLQSTNSKERRKRFKIKGIKNNVIDDEQISQIRQVQFENSSDEQEIRYKKKRKRF